MYVGISLDAARRLKEHVGGSRWFDKVSHVTVETFKTRREAEVAEEIAIKSERPTFNVTHGQPKARQMGHIEFREIRDRLGFTQAGLASFLGYGSPMRISEFERATNPRPVPDHLARLMTAYDEGYRPKDWPL